MGHFRGSQIILDKLSFLFDPNNVLSFNPDTYGVENYLVYDLMYQKSGEVFWDPDTNLPSTFNNNRLSSFTLNYTDYSQSYRSGIHWGETGINYNTRQQTFFLLIKPILPIFPDPDGGYGSQALIQSIRANNNFDRRNLRFIFKHTSNSSIAFNIYYNIGNQLGGSYSIPVTDTTFENWTLLTFRLDRSTEFSGNGGYRFYINGQQVLPNSTLSSLLLNLDFTNFSRFSLGRSGYGPNYKNVAGDYSIAMVYDRLLTNQEIKHNYQVLSEKFGI